MPEPEPVTLAAAERWTTPDPEGGAGVRVTLALPVDRGDTPVPVLVLLDGDTMFLTATEFARTVRRVTMGELPAVAVIGVMRDEGDLLAYVASRFRDFTPQEWVLPGPFAEDNGQMRFGSGGAPAFLDLLAGVVVPEAVARMAAAGLEAGDVSIGGWSLSGLFACWAWLERPDAFRHLLAVSPSLWWDDGSLLDRPLGALAGRRAFVCAGEHEEGEVERVWPQRFANGAQRRLAAMVGNAERFAGRAAEAGAEVEHVTFAGEHHVTLQAAAVARGMRFLVR